MKTRVFYTAVLSLVSVLTVAAQGSLEVKITNIRETKGTIRVGLFNTEESFLKKPVFGKVVKASNEEITVHFENLKSGAYGLSVIHDENDNGELDSNMMGLPKEGFGFGNNAMGMFGPPSFEKAKVVIEDKKGEAHVVTLKYL